jgi:hypothetical protein
MPLLVLVGRNMATYPLPLTLRQAQGERKTKSNQEWCREISSGTAKSVIPLVLSLSKHDKLTLRQAQG